MIELLATEFNVIDPITFNDSQLLNHVFEEIEAKINHNEYNKHYKDCYISYHEAFFLFYYNSDVTKKLFERVFNTKNCNYSAICDIVRMGTGFNIETIESMSSDRLWELYKNNRRKG